MNSHDMSIKAIFELKRQELVLAKLNPETKEFVDDAYVYAIRHRLCPVFHDSDGDIDPFEICYSTSREFALEVLDYADQQWMSKNKLTFYTLEQKFGHNSRVDLLIILRYAFLAHRFDQEFFNDLISECPSEAGRINTPLKQEALALYLF